MRRFVFLAMAVALSACDGIGGFNVSGRPRPVEHYLIASPNGEPLGYASDRQQCEALLSGWFATADANRDGQISDSEMYSDAVRWFRRADTDGNGAITVEELTTLRQGLAGRPEASPPGADRRTRLERDRPVVREPDPVMAADINLDFRVSEDELLAMAGRRYATLTRRGPADKAAVTADCDRKTFRWS